jgi:hypothetical protein
MPIIESIRHGGRRMAFVGAVWGEHHLAEEKAVTAILACRFVRITVVLVLRGRMCGVGQRP